MVAFSTPLNFGPRAPVIQRSTCWKGILWPNFCSYLFQAMKSEQCPDWTPDRLPDLRSSFGSWACQFVFEELALAVLVELVFCSTCWAGILQYLLSRCFPPHFSKKAFYSIFPSRSSITDLKYTSELTSLWCYESRSVSYCEARGVTDFAYTIFFVTIGGIISLLFDNDT